ncbi:TPA: cell envelope integrity protein TolA [Klebsiella pneumoniae]|nr:cell envelope integrity protein TolA [Klebsiella pneumoniae]
MNLRAFSAPILTLVLLITACSNYTQKTNVRVMPGNDKSAEVDDLLGNLGSPTFPPEHSKIVVYAAQIRNAIVAEMYEPDAYKGKTCSIRIYLQPDGSVNSATAKEGDAKLCKAAISAITRAKIPAAPDNETYQRVKNAALDFRL